jgi:toxin ParE1/3/4
MRREVLLTEDAERDLEDIYDYIVEFDSRRHADHVLDRLLEVVERLETLPERGSQPKELRSIGIQEYRQGFFKPYRVIYRVIGDQVIIYLIADGRRDMQSLLSRRLLGG